MHSLQTAYLPHNTFPRKPPAAHAGTQVRLQHLTLQAATCPSRDPRSFATNKLLATQHLTPQATSCPRRDPGALATNKLTCNTTPSPTRPSHCLARKCTSSDLSGKHLMPPAAHTGTQVRWLHFITLQATSCPRRNFPRKPPAAHAGTQVRLQHLTLQATTCPSRGPGSFATNQLLATQHLTPQATSYPGRNPGAFATLGTTNILATQGLPPQATSCPRRDPSALATPDTASHQLPTGAQVPLQSNSLPPVPGDTQPGPQVQDTRVSIHVKLSSGTLL